MDADQAPNEVPMDTCTPRITPDMLGQWEGKTVRLCGRVRTERHRLSQRAPTTPPAR